MQHNRETSSPTTQSSQSIKSIEACAAHYGEQRDAMRQYLIEGEQRALAMANRGPLKFGPDGQLDAAIREAYSHYGFYIFEGVLAQEEIRDLEDDLERMCKLFPARNGDALNPEGGPALGYGHNTLSLLWSTPLGDPLGGTELANGRHQVKLFEPEAAQDAPPEAPFILLGSLQYSPACLRTYGHPLLLKVAESIHGEDFAPFHECLFMKEPGLGAAVSWHQDGDTHWDSADFDEDIHGFNFMAQVYGSTAVNGVWVVPGTHRSGRADIRKMVAEAGSERLPDAVPMICKAGDVVICNRQIVHGSFANTGYERRITVNFGFHRRAAVLDVQGAGIHTAAATYDTEHINTRSQVIGLAIDARRQRFPQETPYNYKPLAGQAFHWTPEAQQQLKDYNLYDLSI
ncbi:MAG: phytanoyl-CoA dioxygenase family protein [Pseudomonadales bacterium]